MVTKKTIGELYTKHFKILVCCAQREFGVSFEDAEDLAQSAFEKAIKNFDSFEPQHEGSELGWLKTILRNLFIDLKRSKAGKMRDLIVHVDSEQNTSVLEVWPCLRSKQAFEFAEHAIFTIEILRAAALTEYEVDILSLLIIHDLRPKDIATLHGRSPKNVSNILYKAKQKLQNSIDITYVYE